MELRPGAPFEDLNRLQKSLLHHHAFLVEAEDNYTRDAKFAASSDKTKRSVAVVFATERGRERNSSSSISQLLPGNLLPCSDGNFHSDTMTAPQIQLEIDQPQVPDEVSCLIRVPQ